MELADEDTVAIGEFEFVFHRLVSIEPASQAVMNEALVTEEELLSGEVDLTQLTVAELASLIEEEALQITEFNRNRERGATALIDAAHRAGTELHPASVPMTAFRQTTTADGLAAQLQRQSQQLTAREAECLNRASQIQAAQQQLAAHMAEFAQQVADWQASENPAAHRASA